MKVLVTGAAGFIGSHIVDLLIAQGIEVVGVDNLSTGQIENVNVQADFYKADIRDGSAITDIFDIENPEAVFHLAAQMDVRKSWADPNFDAEVNVLGALNVIRAAGRFGVKKFIHASTSAVYGNPTFTPVVESHRCRPICPYGATKHMTELYLSMWQEREGMNWVALRFPNVYGPRQRMDGEAGVIAIFAGRMLAGEPVTIRGSGDIERDYVYVSDIARANLLALTTDVGGVFNLGSGVGTSVNTIYKMLIRLTGCAITVKMAPLMDGEMQSISLDASKFTQATGWRPEVSLEDGMRQVIAAGASHAA